MQVQSTSEAERQKWYYNRKAYAISLETGDLVLAKADAYKEKRKVKDWWEQEPYEVECWVADVIPLYCVYPADRMLMSLPPKLTFSHHSCKGHTPLYGHVSWVGRVHHHHPRGTDSRWGWAWESTRKCELCAASPATDSLESSGFGKQEALCYPLDVFQSLPVGSRVKIWCRGTRGVRESMLVFWQWRYWSHCWCLYDTTSHNKLNPTSLHSREWKLITGGCKMGVLAHASIFWWPSCPQHWCYENTWHCHIRDPVPLIPYQMNINPALNTNLEHFIKMLEALVEPPSPVWECYVIWFTHS